MAHIQNEIVCAAKEHIHDESVYVATLELTLEVTKSQSFNPSLSFIHPYATMGNTFTEAFSAQYSKQQHRTMTLGVSMLVSKAYASQVPCVDGGGPGTSAGDIQGTLGIGDIFASGIVFHDPTSPLRLPVLGLRKFDGSLTAPEGSQAVPTFGSTVDFTLTYGAGGGPNWHITRFDGISPSGTLLNAMQINKDTLQIVFAKAVPKPPAPTPAVSPRTPAPPPPTPAPAPGPTIAPDAVSIDAATLATQNQLTRQLLRSLIR